MYTEEALSDHRPPSSPRMRSGSSGRTSLKDGIQSISRKVHGSASTPPSGRGREPPQVRATSLFATLFTVGWNGRPRVDQGLVRLSFRAKSGNSTLVCFKETTLVST